MQLVKYEAACRALAEAKTVDEVKEISGIAEAARAYAKQVQNKSLELDALEIRTRAERRLGEILLQMRKDRLLGQGRGGSPIKLSDLGLDHKISPPAQRLAKLTSQRFESELSNWRSDAESSIHLKVPLQAFRNPAARADQQRVAARRKQVDTKDWADKFRATDGRRVVDWRVGELDRIEQISLRVVAAVRALRDAMPVANADPLDTMEMVFDRPKLERLLTGVWSVSVDCGDAGLKGDRIRASRADRQRTCENCSKPFVMDSRRSTSGRFCSRQCSDTGRKRRSQH